MELTIISDTHRTMPPLQPADVLIHCGDFSNLGKKYEVEAFARWLKNIHKDFGHILCIAGNHDVYMETNPIEGEDILCSAVQNLRYLKDSYITIDDMIFYGAPWQPKFGDWAFALPRNGPEIAAVWNKIPKETDVLITHGPPFGKLDRNGEGFPCGCEILIEKVEEICPSIHAFGHIHQGYGTSYNYDKDILYVNASIIPGMWDDGMNNPHFFNNITPKKGTKNG